MSLPTFIPPPGVNPYSFYLAGLQGLLYRDPTDGFRARLIVLLSLTGLCMLLAIAYLVLVFVEARKTGSQPLWLFRLARRDGGSYIITNGKLFNGLCTIIYGAVTIGYINDSYHVFVLKGSQASTSAWRSLSFIPIFVQGWLITWSALQASILSTDHHARRILSPMIANALFVVFGLLLLVGAITTATINIVKGNEVWRVYMDLKTGLEGFAATWQEGDNGQANIVSLLPALNKLLLNAGSFKKTSLAQLAIFSSVPFFIMLVNLGALRLAMVISKQITFNVEQAVGTLATGGDTHLTYRSMGSVLSTDSTRRDSVGNRGRLSRTEMSYLANRRGSNGTEMERIRHIQALQKAKRDLVVVAFVMLIAMSFILGISLFLLYISSADSASTATWPMYEAGLFGTCYCYTICMTFAFIGLIWNVWRSRAIPQTVDGLPIAFASNGLESGSKPGGFGGSGGGGGGGSGSMSSGDLVKFLGPLPGSVGQSPLDTGNGHGVRMKTFPALIESSAELEQLEFEKPSTGTTSEAEKEEKVEKARRPSVGFV